MYPFYDLFVTQKFSYCGRLNEGASARCLLTSEENISMTTDRFYTLSQKCENQVLASSCLSFRKEQRGSHFTDFHEIWH